MKELNLGVLIAFIVMIPGYGALAAESGKAELRGMAAAIAKSGHATLLVEETPAGQPGEILLSAGQIEKGDLGSSADDDYTLADEPVLLPESGNNSIFQFARSGYGGIYTVFLAAGGQLGLSIANTLEVGIDGGGVGSLVGGLYVGPYVKLAPVPYKAGKRIYLHGRIYRAWIFGPENGDHATFDVAEVGLGYRHMTEKAMQAGQFWSVEGGLLMDIACRDSLGNCKVGDDFAIPTLRFGMNFR